MTRQITLELPDELYEQARSWAAFSRKDMPGVLTDALSLVLTPLPARMDEQAEIGGLSDRQVLALSSVQMDVEQGEEMAELLRQQSADTLTSDGQRRLTALMQIYHQLWLRQSAALAEAVRRGLRPPLQA